MIKYRVWDNKCNTYLNLVGAEIGNHNTKFCGFKYVYLKPQNEEVKIQNPIPRYGGCVGFKLTDSADADRLIFEQYTGLKDKNGVEIAVGDILGLYESYVESDGTTSEELEPWGEVVQTATATLVNSVRTGTFNDIICDEEDPSEPMAEVEVIGNIHENAELLEESS